MVRICAVAKNLDDEDLKSQFLQSNLGPRTRLTVKTERVRPDRKSEASARFSQQTYHQNRSDCSNDVQTFGRLHPDPHVISIICTGLAETISGQRRKEILNWISTVAYADNHEATSSGLLEDTGDWLRNKPQFQEWQASSASGILWLHGKRKPD
jgi:hypothetical protein